jgi:hypothetical protein
MAPIREMTGIELEDLVRTLVEDEGCPADRYELAVWLEADEHDLGNIESALVNLGYVEA